MAATTLSRWSPWLLAVILCSCVFHSSSMASSALRNAVVTGANRGLGLELCRQLGASGDYSRIFALCRKSSPELAALASGDASKVIVVEGIDVVNGGYEQALSTALVHDGAVVPIALLIHNAGAYGPPEEFSDASQVYASQTLDAITPERMTYAFQLNSVAPLFLTKQLLPHLRASNGDDGSSTKVIIISSLMGSLADNTSGGHYGYRTAKAAVNMIGKSLSADLAKDKISVGLIHPGFVHTGFGTGNPNQAKRNGQRNVEESVVGVLQAIEQVNMVNTGCFLHGNYGEGVKPLAW